MVPDPWWWHFFFIYSCYWYKNQFGREKKSCYPVLPVYPGKIFLLTEYSYKACSCWHYWTVLLAISWVKQARIPSRVYIKMRPVWLWSTAKPIFQQITNLTFDPMTLTLKQCVAFINVNPHTKFGFNPTNSIWVIHVTRNACWLLTGEFDLDTSSDDLDLDTAHWQYILNMYTKFEFNPTNGSSSRARTKFSPNREYDLDLWPYDLDLITNSSPHRCLPTHQVWSQSDQ